MIKTNNEMGIRFASKSVNIGFENRVIPERMIAIINTGSAPIKRMIKASKENNMLIDGTCGRPTRSVIITDSNHVILSSVSPRKLSARMNKNDIG